MNQRLEKMKLRVRDREHKRLRQESPPDVLSECEGEGLSWIRRAARLTRRQCEAETVVIPSDERIVFTRTIPGVPPIYSPKDWEALFINKKAHELGPINNICADWGMVLSEGLLGRRKRAQDARQRFADDPEVVESLDCAIETIDAVIALANRYAAEAQRIGRDDIAAMLQHVPANKPRSFHEALQSLRLSQAVLWLSGHYHVGWGRFDQYMWPYLKADLDCGRLDIDDAEELLAEFFISLNKDSDLYPGIQQGDNGQSLMLGGVKRDGTGGVNDLTRMTLRVAEAVSMIDPKINLRITPETDLDLLELAASLTRKALGFPQYSNDDVVIDGLVHLGYDIEDARDYSVAACWEYLIPGKGMEVVNIGAVSFPAAVNKGILEGLAAGDDFDGILARVEQDIHQQVDARLAPYRNLLLPPAPYYSVLMDNCLEQGRDLSQGAKYNNFGIHGAASANAADALAAAKQFVFEQSSVERGELVNALVTDYEGYESLQQKLAQEGPKVGNNDDAADRMLVWLFDALADACEEHRENGRGVFVRPGSGSAMYYVWLAQGSEGMCEPVVGATADGRRESEFFSSSLAPSPGVSVRGPISVLQSYAKIDYRRICNGGPITMELSDTVFHDDDSLRKVAMLMRTFAQLGCQQLQLNTLNVKTLREAKVCPEKHKNLIVRVWGWSGYFCELAPEYQDQIIQRNMYTMS